jgi:hypothetical protein
MAGMVRSAGSLSRPPVLLGLAALGLAVALGSVFLLRTRRHAPEVGAPSWKPGAPPVLLAGEKEECLLPDGYHFTYQFSQRPSLGTVILKLQVFDPQGSRVSGFGVKGRYGMSEMKGAHDSGEQDFKLNRKGDYLLPLSLVMPGEWEVFIAFFKDGRPFFHGVFRVKV